MRLPWQKSAGAPAFDSSAGELPEHLEPWEPLPAIRWRLLITILVGAQIGVILRPVHHLLEVVQALRKAG